MLLQSAISNEEFELVFGSTDFCSAMEGRDYPGHCLLYLVKLWSATEVL